MLHALVNCGLYSNYQQVKRLNRNIVREYGSFINRSYIDKGFFVHAHFVKIAIMGKTKRFAKARKFTSLKKLPKKGSFILNIYTRNDVVSHAVAVRDGMVYDSHFPIALSIADYGNRCIVNDSCFKIN